MQLPLFLWLEHRRRVGNFALAMHIIEDQHLMVPRGVQVVGVAALGLKSWMGLKIDASDDDGGVSKHYDAIS